MQWLPADDTAKSEQNIWEYVTKPFWKKGGNGSMCCPDVSINLGVSLDFKHCRGGVPVNPALITDLIDSAKM